MSSKWLILVCEPASKRRRGRPRKNGGQETASITSTSKLTDSAPGADMEGLDNLLSVAEAFERSQQPDFNDITHPGMTDISNCLLIAVQGSISCTFFAERTSKRSIYPIALFADAQLLRYKNLRKRWANGELLNFYNREIDPWRQVLSDKIPIFALLAMYVTNFSCISYCSNSEYWTQKCIQNESIHSTILDVHFLFYKW